jgi:RNA polymerase sigma-70 factor (ECF subfamily)
MGCLQGRPSRYSNGAMGTPARGSIEPLRLVPRDSASRSPDVRPVLDDRALVAAVKASDDAVASAFCERVWPSVDRTIRRLLGSCDADRDDVAQLALIELVTTIGRYRGDCSLDGWAQTITSHVIFKHIRRRQLERRIFTDLLAEDSATLAAPTRDESRANTRELLRRVAVHLDEMVAERAWAFVMHDILGYDLREIAQMTSSSLAAAQSRLVRGRRELHARVAQDPALVEMLETMTEAP